MLATRPQFLQEKKIKHLACILALICSLNASAQCNITNSTTYNGEWAKYDAYYNWGFIWLHAGEVIFTTRDTVYNGKDLFKLQAFGRTLSAYDFFFSVRDTFESIVEPISLSPHYFYQHNLEANTLTHNEWVYSQTDSIMRGFSTTGSIKKHTTIPVDTTWNTCSFDLLTMVYKARNLNFDNCKINDKLPITLIINAVPYDLYIRFLGREPITTKSGKTYNCLKFSPLLVEGTIFTGGEGMTVWVTDDSRRVPVLVEAKILVGSVKAMLAEVK